MNIREMKGWATVDHTWELLGSRPTGINDLAFIQETKQFHASLKD